MGERIHQVAHGFAGAADAYGRGRPSYPAAAVDQLCRGLGIQDGAAVADLGAGTGALTRLLADRGIVVTAVEPVAEMRAALDGIHGVSPVDGTAEHTGLPAGSMRAAVAGQAWQWFHGPAALAEAARVLVPDGGLGTIRNEMDRSVPWVAAVRGIRAFAQPAGYPAYDRRRLLAEIDAASGWDEPVIRSFPYLFPTSREGVADRVLSTSYVAALPAVERDRVREQVLDVLTDQPDRLDFPYLTEVVTIRRT